MNFTFYSENLIETLTACQLAYIDSDGAGSTTTDTTANLATLFDRTSSAQLAFSIPANHEYAEFFFTLSSASVISSVQLKNINFKNFRLALFGGGIISLTTAYEGTGTSYWTDFSSANLIVEFASVTSSTFVIDVYTTTNADPKKGLIGEVIIGDKIFRLPRNPDAKGYDPELANQKFEVKTVDGGSVIYNQTAKFNAKIKLEWVDQSTTMTDLKGLYDLAQAFTFTPYPTIASWQGESYECNWVGVFDFLQNKYNYRGTPYYAGTMQLKETPL